MANTSKNKNDRPATLPDGLALPQEQEIEKAILSGLMASHRHMPTLAAQLLPEMFTLPQVAMAFEAYLNIYNRGESADALSVDGIWKPATSTCLPTHGTCGRPTWRGSSC